MATRQSLLERVKDWKDRESWTEFYQIYAPLLFRMARRFQISEEDAHEVVQEAMLKMAKRLPGFSYDPAKGSFRGWLRQLVRNEVIGRWRREQKHHEQRVSDEAFSQNMFVDRLADPDALDFDELWEEEWRKTLYETAKERVRAKAKSRQYQIFYCAVVKEWSARRVCKDLRVSLGQVYFSRNKIEKLIQGEIDDLRKVLE